MSSYNFYWVPVAGEVIVETAVAGVVGEAGALDGVLAALTQQLFAAVPPNADLADDGEEDRGNDTTLAGRTEVRL
jgi:hypothetical protein